MTDEHMKFDYFDQLNVEKPDGLSKINLDTFVTTSWIPDEQDEHWLKNYETNKHLLTPHPKTKDAVGKAAIFVGGSPAFKKQIPLLRQLNRNYLIIASNSTYHTLLDSGVRVDYVIAIEVGDHIVKDLTVSGNGTILIHSPFVSPIILENWKGERYCYLVGGGRKYDAAIRKDWPEIDIGGGNVVSTGILWAYKYLHCRDFILIGMSLCYYDDYYHDGRSTDHIGSDLDQWAGWYKAVDMYGKVVNTTPALTMYKAWLETYLQYAQGATFINATEDGVLGVYPEPVSMEGTILKYKIGYIPWINILPLEVAINAYNMKFLEESNGT